MRSADERSVFRTWPHPDANPYMYLCGENRAAIKVVS
jgi:hypothetical protein